MRSRTLTALRVCLAVVPAALHAATPTAQVPNAVRNPPTVAGGPAAGKVDPNLKAVVYLSGAMPTGLAVSKSGRVFISIPRWGDSTDVTAAEVVDGKLVAFPNAELNRFEFPESIRENTATTRQVMDAKYPLDPATHLVSVQSVVTDSKDRLWLLDTGSINLNPHLENGPKLVRIDLSDGDKAAQTIPIPPSGLTPNTYLNDVRFDLSRGPQGTAYITDSGGTGGIIVLDLATRQAWRKLDGHPSVAAEPKFIPIVEGKPMRPLGPDGKPAGYVSFNADGIALSPDGKTLYYTAIASRHLYSIPTDVLADRTASKEQVAAAVNDLGDKGFANDGMFADAKGRLYFTDVEQGAIKRRKLDGSYETLVQDGRIIWPDTLAIAPDGRVLFTNNQLDRQPLYRGTDARTGPYSIMSIMADPADAKAIGPR